MFPTTNYSLLSPKLCTHPSRSCSSNAFRPNTIPIPEEFTEHSTHSTPTYGPRLILGYYFLLEDEALTKPEKPYNPDVLASPCFQVLSVRLQTHFNDNRSCSIYGSITVTEEDDTAATLVIYQRQDYDAETFQNKDTFLSLTGPWLGESLSSISRCRGATMHITLRDHVRDVEVIHGELNFGSMIDDEDNAYDKVQKAVVNGQHGNITVYYTTLLYGVLAKIELSFINNEYYGGDPPSDVYLIVTANFGSSKLDKTEEALEMLLVKRPLNDILQDAGGSVFLSRHAVAVPVCASLAVKVSLYHTSGQKICSWVKFFEDSLYDPYFNVKYGHVKAEVHWDCEYSRSIKKKMSVWGSLVPASSESRSQDVVEVFSIRVCGINHDVHNVCGTVTIDDGIRLNIFQKDEKNPESLVPGDETLSLLGPEQICRDSFFGLRLDLKDPKKQLELSIGGLEWTGCDLCRPLEYNWYDTRLCSVIRGKDGFAVVHYTIFSFGVIAAIEAKMYFATAANVDALIHGSLVVRYGNYEYLTGYEEKYYKTRVFSRTEKDRLWLAKGDNIPLTRPSVGAPNSPSSLIIEADLKATSGSKGIQIPEEEVRGEAEFEVGSTASQRIVGVRGFYFIELSVKWCY